MASIKLLCVLGSTGSIGQSTLEIVRQFPHLYQIHTLVAQKNYSLLIQQAREFKPSVVVIENPSCYLVLKEALAGLDIEVKAGRQAVIESVKANHDLVIAAIVGMAGLEPIIQALESKKNIAVANKEALICGGPLLMKKAKENNIQILPIDSEHNGLFQLLHNQTKPDKYILTASGGPFLNCTYETLQDVTLSQALNHPKWKMGVKNTIDSATLMNKGLEVIEASYLFDLPARSIDVWVHPQSLVHAVIYFPNGSYLMQMSQTDMKIPIHYCLSYPLAVPFKDKSLSFVDMQELNFYPPNKKLFPCLDLAYQVLNKEWGASIILNAANEIAVEKFLNGKIAFLEIASFIEKMLEKISYSSPKSFSDIFALDKITRDFALSL